MQSFDRSNAGLRFFVMWRLYTVPQYKLAPYTIVNNCIKLKLPLMHVNVQYFAVNSEGVQNIWFKSMNGNIIEEITL